MNKVDVFLVFLNNKYIGKFQGFIILQYNSYITLCYLHLTGNLTIHQVKYYTKNMAKVNSWGQAKVGAGAHVNNDIFITHIDFTQYNQKVELLHSR